MRLLVRSFLVRYSFISIAILIFFLFSVSACAEKVDFSLKDIDGKTHRLSDYRGKWVLVNYWATWCPPCLEEIPELVHFHEEHKDNDAVVLGVNFEKIKVEKLRTFIEEYFVIYPVLLTEPSPTSPLGPITGLPTSFLISPGGELVATKIGPVTIKSIENLIYKKSAHKKESKE